MFLRVHRKTRTCDVRRCGLYVAGSAFFVLARSAISARGHCLRCGSSWISCESFWFADSPMIQAVCSSDFVSLLGWMHFFDPTLNSQPWLTQTVKCWQSMTKCKWQSLHWLEKATRYPVANGCHVTTRLHVIYLSSKNLCHSEFPPTLCTEQGVLWHHGDGEASATTRPWRCVQVEQGLRWTESIASALIRHWFLFATLVLIWLKCVEISWRIVQSVVRSTLSHRLAQAFWGSWSENGSGGPNVWQCSWRQN